MESQETQINDRATGIQSGATPLAETELPMHIPTQADFMAMMRSPAQSKPWTYEQLLSQEKRVGKFSITTSTSQTIPVWTFQHTFDNVASLHFPNRKNDFKNYSWKLHFRLQFRSNWQQVGQIVVVQHNIPQNVFGYLTGQPTFLALNNDYAIMTMLPHTKVAMGEDTDVEVEMPWNLPVAASYASMANYVQTAPIAGVPALLRSPDMGTVSIYAPWQMQVANGVNPQMTVEIWSYLTDLTLGGYDPQTGFIT